MPHPAAAQVAGAGVVVFCFRRMAHPLGAVKGVDRVVTREGDDPEEMLRLDGQCPMMSLPGLLGAMPETIPPAPTTTPTPTPTPPVTVLGVQWQTLKLSKRKTSKVLVIGFSGALDPGAARALGDHRLATVGTARKSRAHASKAVRLISATYDPSGHTVTLTPRGKVPASPLQLTITAAGTLDAQGVRSTVIAMDSRA